MPIRKKGDVEIKTSANGTKVRQTGYTFYSYDKNSAALYFQFRGQDGQPTDLSKATIRLVMILDDDGGKKFIPGDDEIEVLSAIRGTAKYVLPDNLLGYEGKVTSYVYLDFSDGSHTDEGHFAFEIKRSLITDVIPEAGDKYVKDFEDIKAEVQEAAYGATESITTAADSIDKAKSNAEATISDHVSSVGSAKEAAEKRINDASSEVETAKVEAVKNMSELDISDKNYLLDSKKRVLEARTSGKPADNANYDTYFLSEPIQAGVEFTVSGQLEITDGDFDNISIKFRDENNAPIGSSFYVEHSGNEFSGTFTLSQTAYRMYIYAGKLGGTRGNGVIYENVKLQLGSIATPWTPNPSEIVTKDQYNKLVNAITSLGGSI